LKRIGDRARQNKVSHTKKTDFQLDFHKNRTLGRAVQHGVPEETRAAHLAQNIHKLKQNVL
jgi:hypothetical protein